MGIKQIIEAYPKKKRIPAKDGSKLIRVAECFSDTIQGENLAGYPATFLRLQFCTLNCVWCFHENTLISKKEGGQVKIKDIKEGDVLLTLDEKSGKIVETKVKKTMKRKSNISEMISFEVGKKGNPIVCTKNHRFYVKNKGWTEAQYLNLNDIILDVNGKQRVSYNMATNNPVKNISSEELSLRAKKTFTGKKHSKEHNRKNSEWHKLNNCMKNPETVKKAAISRKKRATNLEQRFINLFDEMELPVKYVGNNKLAVGNKQFRYRFPDFVVEGKKKLIEIYDTTFKYLYNGIRKQRDKFWINKTKEHYNNFGYEVLFLSQLDLNDNIKSKLFNYIYNGKKITKINMLSNDDVYTIKQRSRLFGNASVKECNVYNLSCSPFNTYLVQGCLAHNCDTAEVWRKGNQYSINELLKIFEKEGVIRRLTQGQHLVLTGGSPLKQQDALIELLDTIVERYGFTPFVEIENECTLMPKDELTKYIKVWNNSPKLENSGMSKKLRYHPEILSFLSELRNSYFKFVVTSEQDWDEIERDFLDPKLIYKKQIVLMPEGVTRDELREHYEFTVNMAVKHNVRMTDRLQVTIWNKTTGV